MTIRFLTSGESHGKALNTIIEGVPANITIDTNFINKELGRRQIGYGRGGRMLIEKDCANILSGVRHGKSIGSPICLEITNKDFENWVIPMNTEVVEQTQKNIDLIESKKITNVRPGHADFAGAIKYDHSDVRNILERSSARETTTRVATGAIAKSILKEFNIEGISFVNQIGTIKTETPKNIFDYKDEIENNDLRRICLLCLANLVMKI